jgi:hypothetical protein
MTNPLKRARARVSDLILASVSRNNAAIVEEMLRTPIQSLPGTFDDQGRLRYRPRRSLHIALRRTRG